MSGIPNPRRVNSHDLSPQTLMRFRGSVKPESFDDEEFLYPHAGSKGRVLVFTQLGLDLFDDDGPRLELSPDDLSSGDEHLRSLIAEFAASRLDSPVSPSQVRVQFDPNISHGRVRLADPSWPSASTLARFRVYKSGACPQAQGKKRAKHRRRMWAALICTAAVVAVAGFWVGGPLGAVLSAGAFLVLAHINFRHDL